MPYTLRREEIYPNMKNPFIKYGRDFSINYLSNSIFFVSTNFDDFI
jgi:hypothetical protein